MLSKAVPNPLPPTRQKKTTSEWSKEYIQIEGKVKTEIGLRIEPPAQRAGGWLWLTDLYRSASDWLHEGSFGDPKLPKVSRLDSSSFQAERAYGKHHEQSRGLVPRCSNNKSRSAGRAYLPPWLGQKLAVLIGRIAMIRCQLSSLYSSSSLSRKAPRITTAGLQLQNKCSARSAETSDLSIYVSGRESKCQSVFGRSAFSVDTYR